MAEVGAKPSVTGLIPMAHANDMQRSVDFYQLLGMEIRGSLRNPFGMLQWVHLAFDQAHLMLAAHPARWTLASRPCCFTCTRPT